MLQVLEMARDDKHVAVHTAFEDVIPWDPSTPEKNLLRALLTTALADVRKNGNVRKMALEFFLNSDDDYVFSFRSVCEYLELDPEMVLIAAGLNRSNNEIRESH